MAVFPGKDKLKILYDSQDLTDYFFRIFIISIMFFFPAPLPIVF